MRIKTVTGIATACLIVVGGFGCAQNRTDTAMTQATPTPATTAMDDSSTRTSTSAMGPTGTGGSSTPYTTVPADTTPAPPSTSGSTGMTTTDSAPADMPAPQSDRN